MSIGSKRARPVLFGSPWSIYTTRLMVLDVIIKNTLYFSSRTQYFSVVSKGQLLYRQGVSIQFHIIRNTETIYWMDRRRGLLKGQADFKKLNFDG